MRITSLILAALMCVSMSTSADPDGMMIGPYNVSFDLNTSDKYDVGIIQKPEVMEGYGGDEFLRCSFRIASEKNEDHAASIQLEAVKRETSYDELKSRLDNLPLPLDVFDRVIDGHPGVCGVGHGVGVGGTDMHIALYCPPVSPEGFAATVCTIASTLPWDEGTLQLLKTIHIEKNNATS